MSLTRAKTSKIAQLLAHFRDDQVDLIEVAKLVRERVHCISNGIAHL